MSTDSGGLAITPAANKTGHLVPVSVYNEGAKPVHVRAFVTEYNPTDAQHCGPSAPVSWVKLTRTSATVAPGGHATTSATLTASAPKGTSDLLIIWQTVPGKGHGMRHVERPAPRFRKPGPGGSNDYGVRHD